MKVLSTLNFNYISRFVVQVFFLSAFLLYMLNTSFSGSALPPYKKKLDQFDKERNDLDALAIGNSHSRSFHFNSLGLKGVNFYEPAGDIEEAHDKAKIVLKQAINIKTVFIALSPGSLAISQRHIAESYNARLINLKKNTPREKKEKWLFSKNSMNRYLSEIVYLEKIQYQFKLFGLSLFSGFSKSDSCYSNNISESEIQQKSVLIEDGIIGGYPRRLITPACIKDAAIISTINLVRVVNKSIYKEPTIEKLNEQRVLEIADILEKRNGKLIIVIPPLTSDYYESSGVQSLLPRHLISLSKLDTHNNIEVYDFHDHFYKSLAARTNNYFSDPEHLSLSGAINFSKALRKIIE